MKRLMLTGCILALGSLPFASAAAHPEKKSATTRGNDELVIEDPSTTNRLTMSLSDKSAPSDKNALIDLDCDDATLSEIIRQFRHTTGANIICCSSSNLQQRVSLSLHHVPWFESLQSILNTRRFRLEPRGDIYFVNEESTTRPLFTKTYSLNHASAEELTSLFNTNYGTKGKDGKVVRGIATAFPGANTIVVTADEKTLADCEAIIKTVDVPVAQMYIEARFIEASSEALHKLGLQWNQLESWGVSARAITGGMEYNKGKLGTYAAGKTATMREIKDADGNGTGAHTVDYYTRNTLVSDSLSEAPGAGRTAEDMSWLSARGFSGQLSAEDFHLALSAFESLSDVKVFSNPKIIVANGKEALVDMTTKFPNVRVQATRNTSNGSDSFDISTQLETIPGEDKLLFAKECFYSWGIMLSVKPRISKDGLINVEIIPTISQLDDSAITEGTGFYKVSGGDSSAYSSYPVIQVKRLTTDFSMQDGATAVIGGLSKTTEEDIDSGIPYLRKIPWIGPKLFGWKSRGKVQKEIIVFVTIGLADPTNLKKDVGLPKNAILGREYVDGAKLEPGDRTHAAESTRVLDQRPLDQRTPEPESPPETESKPETKPETESKPETTGDKTSSPLEALTN